MSGQTIDQRTAALGLPLPHPQNELQDDILRIRDALMAVDALIAKKADAAAVADEFARLIGEAPGALDTLKELASALANNPDFASFVAGEIQRLDRAIAAGNAGAAGLFRRERLKQICGFDF